MANSVRFTCTRLADTGKKGVILPDSEGCYLTVLGGLNVYNSVGQFYVYEQAKALFEESSIFQRRVQRGVLRGEVGHPNFERGMTEEDYFRRILTIEEKNVCAQHAEIYLDFDNVRDADGNKVIAIMGRVRPSGPHARMLERAFASPNENVCFSIRSFTEDYREGHVVKRVLKNIVTFDFVTEPGIAFAEKFNSPALESLDEHVFSRSVATRAVSDLKKTTVGAGMESAMLTADELFHSLGWGLESQQIPTYMRW